MPSTKSYEDLLTEARKSCTKVEFVLPDMSIVDDVRAQIQNFPETLHRELDARQAILFDQLKQIPSLIGDEVSKKDSGLYKMVDGWRDKIDVGLSKGVNIVSVFHRYLVIVLVVVVVVLLATLCTNIALLSTRRTLYFSVPIVIILIVTMVVKLNQPQRLFPAMRHPIELKHM